MPPSPRMTSYCRSAKVSFDRTRVEPDLYDDLHFGVGHHRRALAILMTRWLTSSSVSGSMART